MNKACRSQVRKVIHGHGFSKERATRAVRRGPDVEIWIIDYLHRGDLNLQACFFLPETDIGWLFDLENALDEDLSDVPCDVACKRVEEALLIPLKSVDSAAEVAYLWHGEWSEKLPFPPGWTIERARVRMMSALFAGDVHLIRNVIEDLREGRLGDVEEQEVASFIRLCAFLRS